MTSYISSYKNLVTSLIIRKSPSNNRVYISSKKERMSYNVEVKNRKLFCTLRHEDAKEQRNTHCNIAS